MQLNLVLCIEVCKNAEKWRSMQSCIQFDCVVGRLDICKKVCKGQSRHLQWKKCGITVVCQCKCQCVNVCQRGLITD